VTGVGLRRGARGPGFVSGLLALTALGCGDRAPGPAGEPLEGRREEVRTASSEGVAVANMGPAERLIVYDATASATMTLLFMRGSAATLLEDGGSVWADQEGARLIRFGRRGQVEEVLGGAPPGAPPLTRPAFAAVRGRDLFAVEGDGQALRFSGGAPTAWVPPPVPAAAVGGAWGVMAATRTLFDVDMMALGPDEPLIWLLGEGAPRPVGRIRMPDQAMLAAVVNAGWVAAAPDGGAYYASAVRPELHRYGADGTRAWVATWPHDGVVEPRFGVTDGTLTPVFRLVQQAMAVGPDGRVYVLATTGSEGPADRLLVFEGDGTLLREGAVDGAAALYVGPCGHVYAADAPSALAHTGERAAGARLAAFDLPELGGLGRVRLDDHRGKVVVVNFWASWCVPCRREMPLLDSLARTLDPARVVVLGLNEDVAPQDGLDFMRELGGVTYAVAEGRGDLRERYGYRGLPYTVVLDGEGRIVKQFYGFGETIDPIGDAVTDELRSGA
jgi:thiol-disulfide isomerase/thioredoxin